MNHEQREFRPQYAYDLERQAGAVVDAQRSGWLYSVPFVLERIEEREEAEQKWYCLGPRLGIKLFSVDCNEKILRGLKPNELLTLIRIIGLRPDICFGRQEFTVAAVLTSDREVIYKSPDFDLETYIEEYDLFRKEEN